MADSALLMGSLELGFGVQLTPVTQAGILEASKVFSLIISIHKIHQLICFQQLVFASRIFFSLILGTSKLSALFLLRRLLPQNRIRLCICNIGIALVVLWGIMAILTTNANCTPSHMLLAAKDNSCKNLDVRISVAMALNCATEFGVLSLAAVFLGQMEVEREQKKWVVMAFLLRVP